MIYRQFDPTIARFISQDPVIEGQEHLSLYQYSWNNPLRYTDPDGRAATDITLLGANNSSVTVKTNLIDVKVNASSLGVDFGGNYTLQGDQILGAALDVVGIFDPTPISDALGAKLAYDQGDYLSAGISTLAVIPYAGDVAKVGKIEKDIKIIDNAIDAVKSGDNAKSLLKQGRSGKQERLMEIANDPKASFADRGWIKQDMNEIAQGKRQNIRNPPGKDLAHERGREAAKGYSYKHSNLQDRDLHRRQHKHDNYGRNNKERPL